MRRLIGAALGATGLVLAVTLPATTAGAQSASCLGQGATIVGTRVTTSSPVRRAMT